MTDPTPEQIFEGFVAKLNELEHEKLWQIFDAFVYQLETRGTIDVRGIMQWPSDRDGNELLRALRLSNATPPGWIARLRPVLDEVAKEKGYKPDERMRGGLVMY